MHTYCDGLKSALWPCSPEIWFQGSGFLLCRHTSRSVSRETLTRPAGSLHTAAQLPIWNEYLSSFSWHSGSPFQITTVICLLKKNKKKIQLWLHKLKLFKTHLQVYSRPSDHLFFVWRGCCKLHWSHQACEPAQTAFLDARSCYSQAKLNSPYWGASPSPGECWVFLE